MRETSDQFESRFTAKVSLDPITGCWLWLAALSHKGYGQFRSINRHGKSAMRGAHIVSYEMVFGPVPDGMELDHLCRVRSCVNPHHVEPVTHKVNTMRGVGSKTHCAQGHPFSATNISIERTKVGQVRRCVICRRAAASKAKSKRREYYREQERNRKRRIRAAIAAQEVCHGARTS